MKVQKFCISDAKLIESPGQDAEIYVGNLVDEKNGGPVTIGYGAGPMKRKLDIWRANRPPLLQPGSPT